MHLCVRTVPKIRAEFTTNVLRRSWDSFKKNVKYFRVF